MDQEIFYCAHFTMVFLCDISYILPIEYRNKFIDVTSFQWQKKNRSKERNKNIYCTVLKMPYVYLYTCRLLYNMRRKIKYLFSNSFN